MNILILSCGTRNKIVQYFKHQIKGQGNVIATDCSDLAPALYDADKFYIVPKMTSSNYINIIFDICKAEHINGILSLIDPELSLLAQHRKEFEALGTTVIGSNYNLCELSLNKYNMYHWLKSHGYNCAKSYIDKQEFYKDLSDGCICFPVFVKPFNGSASIEINIVNDRTTLDLLTDHNKNLMIQEMLLGQEIGADVYIDLISNDVVSIFTKRKIKMRAGETDKSVSFKNAILFQLIEKFVIEAGYRGQIDIDIFQDRLNTEKFYISEVNPRFGGGYPNAYAAGANHMKYIVNNLNGITNKPEIGKNYQSGIYMMKYNEICAGTLDELQKNKGLFE